MFEIILIENSPEDDIHSNNLDFKLAIPRHRYCAYYLKKLLTEIVRFILDVKFKIF